MTKRKLSRREFLNLSGAAAAGAMLASCAPKATEPPVVPTEAPPEVEVPTEAPPPKKIEGVVTMMHFRHEFTEDQEAAFEAMYPDIQVEFVVAEQTRLFAMLAAGTPPDLYRCQAPSIPQYLARRLLYDLTPYFEASTLLKLDDLNSFNDYYKAASPLEIGTGPIYGMCKDASPDLTLFINKAMFQAAGLPIPDDTEALTYQEVYDNALATTVMEGDRILNFGYGGNIDWWSDRQWMNMLAETGAKLYTDQYDAITFGDEAKAIVQYFFNLAKANASVSPVNPSPNGWGGGDFAAGILSQLQHGYWMAPMAETDQTRGNVMMLPGPTWAGVRRDPTITATGMVMLSKTTNPDAAWLLFEYYNGGQPATDRAMAGWGVPALKSLVPLLPQGTEFEAQRFGVLQGELELNTPPLQFNPFIGESTVSDAYFKYLDQALKEQITFDDMIAGITSEVNTSIREGIDRIAG